ARDDLHHLVAHVATTAGKLVRSAQRDGLSERGGAGRRKRERKNCKFDRSHELLLGLYPKLYDAGGAQPGELGIAFAEPAQHLVGVLAKRRGCEAVLDRRL